MALDWSTVKHEHIARAAELVLAGSHRPKVPAKGLFLIYNGEKLPAKHALRLAYCLANNLPLDASVKFASGEGTIRLLETLGFKVDRT